MLSEKTKKNKKKDKRLKDGRERISRRKGGRRVDLHSIFVLRFRTVSMLLATCRVFPPYRLIYRMPFFQQMGTPINGSVHIPTDRLSPIVMAQKKKIDECGGDPWR